ncbi:MAG: GNAT family N-acetyltransferase [Dinoroseobacter sp.]|nr:GNAT family N-acetyltransferase [Dinoroseobacter sp.]
MTFLVGPAERTDAAQISALWSRAIRETDITFNSVEKSEADIFSLLAEKSATGQGFFVAREDTRVLGFAVYGQFRGGGGYARTMEHTIYLADSVQGRGVGRALMAAIEDHARAGGAHSMWGGITATNTSSIAFHARLGYVEMARLPEVGYKWGRLMDLVLMRKLL